MSERLFEYDNEPFCLLEGGTGLNELEGHVYHRLVDKNFEVWSLENLYEKPERLASLQFLKPKTLIFGTTAVYQDKLNLLVDLAQSLDLNSVEKVILTLDTDRDMRKQLKIFKEKYPKIKWYKFKHFFEDEKTDIMIKEII